MRGLLIVTLVGARTASARCYSNEDCPSWQVCTVSLGACDSGDDNADVCRGRCVAGERFAFVPRLGAGLLDRDLGAAVGLEIVPPIFGGRLGVAVDYWTQSMVRLGVVATWHAASLLAVSARIDVTRGSDTTGAMGVIRLESSPIPQAPLSIFVEGGIWRADASTAPAGCAGIAVWL